MPIYRILPGGEIPRDGSKTRTVTDTIITMPKYAEG